MERFALGHASGTDWKAVCQDCLQQLGTLPAEANIGFIYLTDYFVADSRSIVAFLKGETGLDRWVGTSGHGVLASGREYYDEPAIVVMAGAFPDGSFNVFKAGHGPLDELLDRHGAWLGASQSHFGIVHADPRTPHLDALLPQFVASTNSFLVGGLTSSSAGYPQIADTVDSETPFSGVLFSSGVEVVSGLTQGCTPLGPTHEITEARGNVLSSLDHRPALEVLKEDVGELLARDLRRIGDYIFVALPVSGSDRGDYVVRNLTGIDPERGLVGVGARLDAGRRLMFCRRDATSARADLKRMLADVKHRAGRTPRGAVYYSCVARGPNMFGPKSGEMGAIREELGDCPIVGFFCNGEISHDRIYGYTGVLSVFL